MKRIKGFESFDESTIYLMNETVLYFLPEIKSALTSMAEDGDDIASRLLQKSGVDTMKDITLVELEGDKLSFMTKGAIDAHNPEFMDKLDNGSYDITNRTGEIIKSFQNRNKIKIGKFVTSVLGPIPDRELEYFVIKLKSSKDRGYEIKVVEGDEISKYYRTESISASCGWNSEIMRSCMRDKGNLNPSVFDIYSKNPESCKMAVMLDDKGELVSRAILWKAANVDLSEKLPDSFWFMDRAYSSENWMDKSMQDWAAKKGYAIKRGNWGSKNVLFKGASVHCEMEVDVKKIAYRGFPYMDTFAYYDVENGKLRNFEAKGFKGFGLQSTMGNYGTTTGHGPVARNYIRRFIK